MAKKPGTIGAADRQQAWIAAYQQVCSSYHGIADFRAKLLGFLPFASGGIFLLLQAQFSTLSNSALAAVGLFGFIVSMGLFIYELRGVQRCNGLIAIGQQIERTLDIPAQFALRPPSVAHVGATLAGCVVYSAVLAAWGFLFALSFAGDDVALAIGLAAFGVIGSGAYVFAQCRLQVSISPDQLAG